VIVALAAFLLGLLSGAMVLIGVALVPFWQSMPPGEFRGWFARHSTRIGRLMIPLGASAAVVALVAAAIERTPPRLLAAAGAGTVASITMLVNEPANHRFASHGNLDDAETTALLARWRRWHWVRIVAGLAGFWGALSALRAGG